MRSAIVMGSCVTLLAGLAACTHVYHHPTKTSADFAQDKRECYDYARHDAFESGAAGNPLIIASVMNQCLVEQKGWIEGDGPANEQPRTNVSAVSKPGVVLGVNPLPVQSAAQAQIFKLDKPQGLWIVVVQPDGVAARTGILAGDVILKYDNKAVNTLSDLQNALAATAQGSTIAITIWRQGKEIVLPASF